MLETGEEAEAGTGDFDEPAAPKNTKTRDLNIFFNNERL